MFQTSFNKENRSTIDKMAEPEKSSEHFTGAGEPHDTRMKISPVITNIGISLLIMVFFAISLHS